MIIFIPILCLFSCYFSIGGDLNGCKLGVVNEEVPNHQDCLDASLETVANINKSCSFNRISCRFVKEINESNIELVIISQLIFWNSDELSCISQTLYDSYDEAYKKFITNKINGFIHISANYSASLNKVISIGSLADTETVENSIIKVSCGTTNYFVTNYIKKTLGELSINFMKSIAINCKFSERVARIP